MATGEKQGRQERVHAEAQRRRSRGVESARGLAQSKTLARLSTLQNTRSVLECGKSATASGGPCGPKGRHFQSHPAAVGSLRCGSDSA